MTPEQLEKRIEKRGMDILKWNALADASRDRGETKAERYRRGIARLAARDVARLVAQRTPETVARMERERNLA